MLFPLRASEAQQIIIQPFSTINRGGKQKESLQLLKSPENNLNTILMSPNFYMSPKLNHLSPRSFLDTSRHNTSHISNALREKSFLSIDRNDSLLNSSGSRYVDTTLFAATQRRERLNKSIERLKNKLIKIHEEKESHLRKQNIIQRVIAKDTKRLLTPRQLELPMQLKFIPEDRLEFILEKRLSQRRQKRAAMCIQRFFRGFRMFRLYQRVQARRLHAAKIIQRCWRKNRWTRLLPKLRYRRHEEAALTVQKYLRGYLVFKKSFKEVVQVKIEDLTDYFSVMRFQLILDAQIKIAYYWRRYLRRCQRLILQQQKLKAEKDKSKKRATQVSHVSQLKNSNIYPGGGGGSGNNQTMKGGLNSII